jgi:hypothetical protein
MDDSQPSGRIKKTNKGGGKGQAAAGGKKYSESEVNRAVADQCMKTARDVREIKGEMFSTFRLPFGHQALQAMKEMGIVYNGETRGKKGHGLGPATGHLWLAFVDTYDDLMASKMRISEPLAGAAPATPLPPLTEAELKVVKALKDYKDVYQNAELTAPEVGVFKTWDEYNEKFALLTHNLKGTAAALFQLLIEAELADNTATRLWGMAPPGANERLIAAYLRQGRK